MKLRRYITHKLGMRIPVLPKSPKKIGLEEFGGQPQEPNFPSP